ncbi:MAG: sensor histidine kinase [Gammaproteobacteria bacterium]|nr:sensor histidine kinase [Gammaproteobacteria bacterium]
MPHNKFDDSPPGRTTADMRRLFMLRNVAIAGQTLAVITATSILHMALPVLPMAGIIAALLLFNIATWFVLRKSWQVSHPAFMLHLLVDVFALSGLLYYTGGATNPFVSLFLIPLAISATVLTSRYTWALSAVTVICYTLLMRDYIPLPHVHVHSEMSPFGMHVYGMWLGFVMSAGIIAYFVVGMGKTLRQREHALAAARERALRDAQLVQLGTLAASTAHELGTPLGTMALLTEELEEICNSNDPEMNERLTLLRSQIERCKTALSTLAVSAGDVRLSGGGVMAIDGYLASLRTEWQQANPGVTLNTHWEGDTPAPAILADRTLSQAITNILDNAADVSPRAIEWNAHWDQKECVLEIRDWGPGLTSEAKQKVGKEPYSEKPEGLGLGLFLAHAIIGRFGGSVTLFNCDDGGSCTRVQLPCQPLLDAAT